MDERTDDKTIREDARAPLITRTGQGSQPCLTVIAGGTVGTTYALSIEDETVIGRSLKADVCFEDQRISRRHARLLIVAKGKALLEDLGSSNGTFVNGQQIQRQEIKDGDKIQIGSTALLKFSYQDETERNAHQELFDRAIKDALTETYTEQYFLDRITTEFAYARRHNGDLAILMFDIDDLKEIHETHGGTALDLVLKELARATGKMLRAEDVLARYGDTAFIVLVRDIDDAGVLVLAQRLRRTIKSHDFLFQDTQIPVTISIGMASLSDKAKKHAKLIRIAEKYMHRAKKVGNSIGGQAVKAHVQRDGRSTTIRYS